MSRYIISIDQSTSATKGLLFDEKLGLLFKASKDHRQHYPMPGWVEHEPEEIYHNTLEVIRDIIRYLIQIRGSGFKIACLSITNQRETVVVWDKTNGTPVYPAIVWQCRRGTEKCKELREAGWEESIKQKTGLLIDPYFSATGVTWILEHVKKARRLANQGNLLFGTIDSWLIWKLTGGKVHATDYSNASRTMLFNIHDLTWDEDIFNKLGIPLDMAPEVRHADDLFGYTNLGGLLKQEVPITGVMGDSHAALFGQRCFRQGMGKATFGTGSSIMFNIGNQPIDSPMGLVTSVGYGLTSGISYVYEGNIHSTGATMAWLKNSLNLFQDVSETEAMALSVSSSEGVYLVPAFAGLGAPYWDNEARANITGLTFGTTKSHLVRAGLESIAFQVKDLIDLMVARAGVRLDQLRVDGGAVKNNFLMQFIADILCTTIAKSQIEDAAALGVAMAGGLQVGLWKDLNDLNSIDLPGEILSGCMDKQLRNQLYEGWKEAVKKTLTL
jgi:glycerol kinase